MCSFAIFGRVCQIHAIGEQSLCMSPIDDAIRQELLQNLILDSESRLDVVLEGVVEVVHVDLDALDLLVVHLCFGAARSAPESVLESSFPIYIRAQ